MPIHRMAACAAVMLAALAAPPASAFETRPFAADGFKAAQSAGKPILVDVFAPWCPTCKAQQQVLKTLETKPEYDKITVFKVDFDNQPDALKSLNARRQSTLIAFNGATETGRSVGETEPQAIEALLKSTLK